MRNGRFFSFVLGVILLLPGMGREAWGKIIYVKANATGSATGASWANAYTDLQSALVTTVAHSGDEVWVAAGTYKPTGTANRGISFEMPTGVAIYGGFAGNEATSSTRNWTTHPTILSGDIGAAGNTADNTYRVVIGARNAELNGFTITGGNYTSGSGMLNGNCAPVVANCTFTANVGGSTMYNYNGAAPTVFNCVFTSNTTDHTGAMLNRASAAPRVLNCVFSGNKVNATGTNDGGAGMVNDGSTSKPSVVNCTFVGNDAGNGKGGAMLNINCSPTVQNCVFRDNKAALGAEIYTSGGTPVFSHCDIEGCGGSGASWATALGADGGDNIDADPLFVNAANPAGADGLWYTSDDGLALQALSPCLNAGLAAGAPTTDILGRARDNTPDLGAYERQAIAPTAAKGELAITYRLTTPSNASGQTVQYTYRWTSTGGDSVTHGPTTATSDTLTEMNLVQAGETWTVTVTPNSGGLNGPSTTAKVKILDPQAGVVQWILYR